MLSVALNVTNSDILHHELIIINVAEVYNTDVCKHMLANVLFS